MKTFVQSILAKRKHLLHFLLWFALANTLLFWLIGSRYLFIILSTKTLFFTSFASYTSFIGKASVLAFTFITFLSHFLALALLPLLIIGIPAILFFNHRFFILPLSILIATSTLLLLMADTLVYALFHFHINLTLIKIAFGQKYSFIAFAELSNAEMVRMTIVGLVVLCVEIALAVFIWKMDTRRFWLMGKKILFAWLACLYLSYLTLIFSMAHNNNIFAQQTPHLPLYNQLFAVLFPFNHALAVMDNFSETRFLQPLFPVSPLHYPLHPLRYSASAAPYNVIIIGIDTWRFDTLNPVLMPQTTAFANTAWRFNQHYSGGNSTQAGLFSLFYSLPNNYWDAMLQAKRGALFIRALLDHHYESKVMFSSDMVPAFNDTIFSEMKNLRTDHAKGENIPLRDHAITQELADFLAKQPASQPFFVFLLYDSAHAYCDTQTIPRIYPVKNQSCERLFLNNESNATDIINRYKNALHFIDGEIGMVLETLKTRHLLENTVVIITGDHGEEFNDNHLNYWGHGSNYTDYQLKTPLIIRWPHKTPKVWTHQTSHYDVVPFLMQNLLGCENPLSDYSIGHGLLNSHPRDYLLAGSYMNMAIIEKNRQITLFSSGDIQVSDNHANNLPQAKLDLTHLTKALWDMRRFFQ